MKPLPRLSLTGASALAVLLAWPAPARALFGAGDIVFDPTNTAQTINVLRETQQEFDRLGTILGVSTRQFDQLVQLTAALGNAVETAPYGLGTSPAQLERAVRSVPGLESADLGSLFDANGLLDAFMGVPLSSWIQAVENPTGFYRDILVRPAIERLGQSAGLPQPAVAYAQWFAARSPEDQGSLGAAAAADFSGLLAGDWLGNARQRRVNLEGLAASSQDAGNRAGGAQTLLDQQHAQAQLSASTNAILLESAAQNADAAEVSVRAAGAQGRILAEQGDALRDAGEMRLDAPP
jgi:hypothetical protein